MGEWGTRLLLSPGKLGGREGTENDFGLDSKRPRRRVFHSRKGDATILLLPSTFCLSRLVSHRYYHSLFPHSSWQWQWQHPAQRELQTWLKYLGTVMTPAHLAKGCMHSVPSPGGDSTLLCSALPCKPDAAPTTERYSVPRAQSTKQKISIRWLQMVANDQQPTPELLKPQPQYLPLNALILGCEKQPLCIYSKADCRRDLRELFLSSFTEGHVGLCYV